MATKKPAWQDMPLSEIEARAKVVFNRDFFAKTQARASAVRADADAVSLEIDREIRSRMSAMSADQLMQINAAVLRGEDISTAVAAVTTRADSAVKNGLRMIEQRDDSGRPIRTFVLEKNATKMSAWMGRYAAVPQEMLALNVGNETQDVFESKRGKHLANKALREQAARDLAAGREVLCDLSIPMDRS